MNTPTTVKTATRANQYGEWLVKVYDQNGKLMPDSTYFGSDKDDMIGTAEAMRKQMAII